MPFIFFAFLCQVGELQRAPEAVRGFQSMTYRQLRQGSHLEVSGPRLRILDGPGGGRVDLKDMSIEFKNKSASWLI